MSRLIDADDLVKRIREQAESYARIQESCKIKSETLFKFMDDVESAPTVKTSDDYKKWSEEIGVHTCATCIRKCEFCDGSTDCPIEHYYALPLDGYCHLWKGVSNIVPSSE